MTNPIKEWNGEGLRLIRATIGLALADHTWVQQVVEFEVDPEFENNDLDLAEEAFDRLSDEIKDSLAPSGWFLIHHEWVDEANEERELAKLREETFSKMAERFAAQGAVEINLGAGPVSSQLPDRGEAPFNKLANMLAHHEGFVGVAEEVDEGGNLTGYVVAVQERTSPVIKFVPSEYQELPVRIASGLIYPKMSSSCKKCGSCLIKKGLCSDSTCPYSDRQQDESYTEG